MIPHLSGRFLKLFAFVAASLVPCLAGLAQEPNPPSSTTAKVIGSSSSESANPAEAAHPKELQPPLSKGVQDVLKMVDAGVSKEVIKAYVENARITGNPTSADMIALKQHGVPDDITIALLKRRSQGRSQNAASDSAPGVAPYPANLPNRAYPDPESYDYFQYNYLYPRTLASMYERLGWYSAPYYSGYPGGFGPYAYRYWGPRAVPPLAR
jgi:hypothetical protein